MFELRIFFFKQIVKKDLLAVDGRSPVNTCSENIQQELGLGIGIYPFHFSIKSMNLKSYKIIISSLNN